MIVEVKEIVQARYGYWAVVGTEQPPLPTIVVEGLSGQAIGRQPQREFDGAPAHYGRHRPEQTTLCRLLQQHGARLIAR